MGVLATVHDGQPCVNSNIFAYDEERNAIYLHTARSGRTRDTVEEDPNAPTLTEVREMMDEVEAEMAAEKEAL